jgi:hypothetical protein
MMPADDLMAMASRLAIFDFSTADARNHASAYPLVYRRYHGALLCIAVYLVFSRQALHY